MPDIPFTGLSLLVFLLANQSRNISNVSALCLAGALTALTRPEGSLVVLCAGAIVFFNGGWKKAFLFCLSALSPVSLWLARDYWLNKTLTGYAANWSSQASSVGGLLAQSQIAARWLAGVLGWNFWGLPTSWPRWLLLVAGGGTLLAAGRGAISLLDGRRDPASRVLSFGISCYIVLLLCLHITWKAVAGRYLLHFLPFLWILILAGLDGGIKPRSTGFLVVALLLFNFMRSDVRLARLGISKPRAITLPKTVAWIKSRTPPNAKFQSIEWPVLLLLTGRSSYPPILIPLRDLWLGAMLSQGISYAQVAHLSPDGFLTPAMAGIIRNEMRWARSSRYIRRVFFNPDENSEIFRVSHPDPSRYLKALDLYQKAVEELLAGKNIARVRQKLIDSAELEPTLSIPWQMLASIEKNPGERLDYLKKAAVAEPESRRIRAVLEAARAAQHARHAGTGRNSS